jgi:hypothetical protein
MPAILATWEDEIRRIVVQGQLGQIVHETPPHLQNNQSKMDWRCGSSSRVPALPAQSPEVKPSSVLLSPKKRERKKKSIVYFHVIELP